MYMYGQDPANLDPEEKKRKLHSLQMESVIHDSDLKKLLSEKSALESELRKIHVDQKRLRILMEEKKERFDGVAREVAEQEEELKHIKKQINLLI